jgi:hypothetical protein
MFYPCADSKPKIQEKASHVLSLQAIQKIWWIFFGEAWRGILQPLLIRLEEGNLNSAFSMNTVQSSIHVLLTSQIQTAFATVGSLLRDTVGRFQHPTESETKKALIVEIQEIFDRVVPPANNIMTNQTRLLFFQTSGRESETLVVLQTLLGKCHPAKKPQGEPKKPLRKEEGKSGERPSKIQKLVDRPCLRNIMLQFFGKQAGLGDVCPSSCFFNHDLVSQINQTDFDKAVAAGPNLFGPIFSTNGCEKKLRTAYGGLDNNGFQHPLLTPEGEQVQAKAHQGGRGPNPNGRGRGRGRGRGGSG